MGTGDHIDEILGQWRENAERGNLVQPESLIESHPDEADVLRERFAALALIDQYYAEEDALPFVTPKRLGDYRIIREIGRGGMGVVYEAEQESMGRRVALKVLYPTVATTVTTRKRFDREARITGRLHHTNIVTVYGMGQDEGYAYFAMELVEGAPLDQLIAHLRSSSKGEAGSESLEGHATALRGPKAHRQIAMMVAGVADALEVAHAQEVIHRDVKPSNLILDDEGELKLTDFGLAHFAGDDFGVTRTGEILGTPAYMSPEQVRARREDLDHRTDVYSLGATLYELLSLERVHESDNVGTLCSKILAEEPRPLRSHDPSIPKDLATIVHKAIRKQRGDRYASAGAMAADLRAFVDGRSIRARPMSPVQRLWRKSRRHKVHLVLIAIALLFAGVAYFQHESSGRARDQLRATEYGGLIARAHEAAECFAGTGHWGLERGDRPATDEAASLFTQAIALDPGRLEGWFGRSLLATREPLERRDDLKRALALGLSERTFHLSIASLQMESRVPSAEVDAQVLLARETVGRAPVDDMLEGYYLIHTAKHAEGLEVLTRAIADAKRPYVRRRAILYRAQAHEQLGEWESAVQDYASLIELGSVDARIPGLLAIAWRRLGRDGQADRVIETAIRRGNTDFSVGQWLDVLGTSQDGDDAWLDKIAEAALAAYPNDPLVLAQYAWHLTYRAEATDEDQLSRAERLMDRALVAMPSRGAVRESVLLRYAQSLDATGQGDRARAVLRGLLKVNPLATGAATVLSQVLYKSHSYDDAVEVLRPLASKLRNDIDILDQLGYALVFASRTDEALALAARIRELQPASPRSSRLKYYCHSKRREFRPALAALDEGLTDHPRNLGLLECRVVCLGNLKRHNEAIEACDHMLGLLPPGRSSGQDFSVGVLKYLRGMDLQWLGRYAAAATSLEDAMRRLEDTIQRRSAALILVRVHRCRGRIALAAQALDEALAMSIQDPGLIAQRAYECERAGRHELAIRENQRAESLGLRPMDGPRGIPRSSRLRLELSLRALIGEGRIDEASGVLQKAAEQYPDSAILLSRLRLGCLVRAASLEAAIHLADSLPPLGPPNAGLRLLAWRLYFSDEVSRAEAARWAQVRWEQDSGAVEAYIQALAGEKGRARELLGESPVPNGSGYWQPMYAAFTHALLENKDEALANAALYLDQERPASFVVFPPEPALLRWKEEAPIAMWISRWEAQKGASAPDRLAARRSESPATSVVLAYLYLLRLNQPGNAVAEFEKALADQTIRGNLGGHHRYNAACAAARAAAESEVDGERDAYRAKALKWLQADVEQRRALFGSSIEPAGHEAAKVAFDKYVAHALVDTDLESLRDAPEFVALFPPSASGVNGKPK